MLKSKATARTERVQNPHSNVQLLQLPRSEMTLAALDILLENPLTSMNGIRLKSMVEERLRRKVNYSGVLKQVRSYAGKPYWNQVIVCQRKSFLSFYAREDRLARRLHREIHGLYEASHALNEAVQLRRDLEALRSRLQTEPLSDTKEINKQIREIEGKLKTLAN